MEHPIFDDSMLIDVDRNESKTAQFLALDSFTLLI